MTLGITQFRLGEDEKGLESLQNGLAFLNGASKGGYRGFLYWDLNGTLRDSIRKTIVQVAEEGLNAKDRIIRSTEVLLVRVDNEERSQGSDEAVERTHQRGDR
jgi:hypothetical protein